MLFGPHHPADGVSETEVGHYRLLVKGGFRPLLVAVEAW